MPSSNSNLSKRVIITAPRGTTKNIQFVFTDSPDLRNADIKFIVIKSFLEPQILFQKTYNPNLTTELDKGIFTITIEPQDTINLESLTYFYDLIITFTDGTIKNPVRGEFIVTETGVDNLTL